MKIYSLTRHYGRLTPEGDKDLLEERSHYWDNFFATHYGAAKFAEERLLGNGDWLEFHGINPSCLLRNRCTEDTIVWHLEADETMKFYMTFIVRSYEVNEETIA